MNSKERRRLIMILRNKVYKIVAISILLSGIIVLGLSLQLPFGSFSNPKAGFVPTVFSVIWVLLALLNCILELKKPDKTPKGFDEIDWKKWLMYIAVCTVYLVLLYSMGYIISTFICLVVMIKMAGYGSIKKSILVSLIFTVCVYLLFAYAMDISLPKPFFI